MTGVNAVSHAVKVGHCALCFSGSYTRFIQLPPIKPRPPYLPSPATVSETCPLGTPVSDTWQQEWPRLDQSAPRISGIQERRATCVESLSKVPVAEELCVNASKPDLNRTCSTEDCDSEWFIGEWEQCSETCGSEGLQYRVTYCHQVRADGTRLTVDDAKCLALSERPAVKQSCNRFPCPEWHAGPWSSCSKPCGNAEQFRSITCRSEKEGEEGKLMADKACNATGKPEDKRDCNLGPCEGLRWVTSEWTLVRFHDTEKLEGF